MLKRRSHADDDQAQQNRIATFGQREQQIAGGGHGQTEHQQSPIAKPLGRDAGDDLQQALGQAFQAFEQADFGEVQPQRLRQHWQQHIDRRRQSILDRVGETTHPEDELALGLNHGIRNLRRAFEATYKRNG